MSNLTFSDRIDDLQYRTDLQYRNGSFLVDIKFPEDTKWTKTHALPEDEIILDIFARGSDFRFWVESAKVANSYNQTFYGFTLQRGHICGTMLNGVKFVTAMERTQKGRVLVYILDGDKWRKIALPAEFAKDPEIRGSLDYRRTKGIAGVQFKPLEQQIRHGYLRPNSKTIMGLPTKGKRK